MKKALKATGAGSAYSLGDEDTLLSLATAAEAREADEAFAKLTETLSSEGTITASQLKGDVRKAQRAHDEVMKKIEEIERKWRKLTEKESRLGQKKKAPKAEKHPIVLNAPKPMYEDLQAWAAEKGDTVTGVLKWAIAAGKLLWDEIRAGRVILSVDPNNDQAPTKQLMLPRY